MKSKMRFLGVLAVLYGASAVVPAVAADTKSLVPGAFSGNVGVFSDYRFRGLTQTAQSPALQGGLNWSMPATKDVSVNLGVWGSNVDFNDSNAATVELDWTAGLSGSYKSFDWSISGIYYSYPGAASSLKYDYKEAALTLGYNVNDALSLGVAYNYSPNNFGNSGKAHFVNGTVSYALPVKFTDVSVNASFGRQWIEKNTTFGAPDYNTWSAGVTAAVTNNVSVSATYMDTSISPSTAANGKTVVGALTASF